MSSRHRPVSATRRRGFPQSRGREVSARGGSSRHFSGSPAQDQEPTPAPSRDVTGNKSQGRAIAPEMGISEHGARGKSSGEDGSAVANLPGEGKHSRSGPRPSSAVCLRPTPSTEPAFKGHGALTCGRTQLVAVREPERRLFTADRWEMGGERGSRDRHGACCLPGAHLGIILLSRPCHGGESRVSVYRKCGNFPNQATLLWCTGVTHNAGRRSPSVCSRHPGSTPSMSNSRPSGHMPCVH